jgi:hypothetical protein
MVLASRPVLSDSRFAARPVGEQRAMRTFYAQIERLCFNTASPPSRHSLTVARVVKVEWPANPWTR